MPKVKEKITKMHAQAVDRAARSLGGGRNSGGQRLARRLGVSESSVSNWRRGLTPVPTWVRKRLGEMK